MVFENILALVNPPENIKKTWFQEWFYGASLKSYWDLIDVTGVGTFGMAFGVDEGFQVSTGAVASDKSAIIAGATERHFDPVASVNISIAKRESAIGRLIIGFGNRTDGDLNNTPDEGLAFQDFDTITFKRLSSVNGVNQTTTDTSIAVDTNFTRYRQELTATTAKGFINGILEATITTDLPSGASKLYCGLLAATLAASATEVRIRYMEAFNV